MEVGVYRIVAKVLLCVSLTENASLLVSIHTISREIV